jgi:hypothetical protein
MARELVEILSCDRHLDNGGERVGGETLTVLDRAGKPVEMELCPACRADLLTGVYEAATRYGRVPEHHPRLAAADLDARRVLCDPRHGGCGNRYVEIRQHVRQKHPDVDVDLIAPRRRRQAPTHNPCPNCDQVFDSPQGFAGHTRAAHPKTDSAATADALTAGV